MIHSDHSYDEYQTTNLHEGHNKTDTVKSMSKHQRASGLHGFVSRISISVQNPQCLQRGTQRERWVGEVGEGKGGIAVAEGDLTVGGERMMQCADDVLELYTCNLYGLFTNVTPINSIKKRISMSVQDTSVPAGWNAEYKAKRHPVILSFVHMKYSAKKVV